MIDFRRLRGPGVLLVLVSAALGAFGLLLALTIGREPLRFLGSDQLTYALVSRELAGGRISGLLRERLDPSPRLGILVGASTLECAVDPAALEVRGAPPWRWLSLPGRGSTAVDLEGMVDLGLRCDVRPDALVLAFDLGMLAEPRAHLSDEGATDAAFDLARLTGHVNARQWKGAADDLRDLVLALPNALFPYRTRVNNRVLYAVHQARSSLLNASGPGTYAIYPPVADPWKVDTDWAKGPHRSPGVLSGQMEGYRARGWFDPGAYHPGGRTSAALLRLIAKAKARGAGVVIVLMPQTLRVRSAIPKGAEHCLLAALGRIAGSSRPTVVDLRDTLPDGLFHDLTHADDRGKQMFTFRLAEALEGRLPDVARAARGADRVVADRH